MSTKLWLIVAILAIAVGGAILLGARSSPDREATFEFHRRFPADALELRFEPQRFRGVVCGHYKMGSGRLGSFVYVSHYSAESPPVDMLTLDSDLSGKERLKRFGCS